MMQTTSQKPRELTRTTALEAVMKSIDGGDLEALAEEYGVEMASTPFLNPDDDRIEGLLGNHRRIVDMLFTLEKGAVGTEPMAVGTDYMVVRFDEERGPVTRDFDDVID